MKQLTGILLLLAGFFAAAAPWHDEAATYRLQVRFEPHDRAHYADLRHLLLPVRLDHGVKVFTLDGQELPFFLSDQLGLFLPGRLAGEAFIYFGYNAPQERHRWPEADMPPPSDATLLVRIVNAWNLAPSEKDWIAMRSAAEYRSAKRREEYARTQYWQSFRHRTLMPMYGFKYSPERWLVIQKLRARQNFAMQLLQSRTPMIRNRRWRPAYEWNYPIYFPPRQANYHAMRMNSLLSGVRSRRQSAPAVYDKIIVDSIGAPDREILAVFDHPRAALRGAGPVREVLLPKRPFDSDGNMAVRYTGLLHIDREGEYEFGVVSNSLALLLLDGEVILSRHGRINPSAVAMQTRKLRLKPGLYDFALYYHKSRVTGNIGGYIRAPGDTAPRILIDHDFRPGYPVRPVRLENRERAAYPIVMRLDRYLLHTGKQEKFHYEAYRSIVPARLDFDWEINGERLPSDRFPRLPIPADGECRLRLLPRDPALQILPIIRYPAPAPPLSLDAGIAQKLWLPRFIYQDERLDAFVEISSKLNSPVNLYWRIEADRPQKLFPIGDDFVALRAKPLEADDRFAADSIRKKRFALNGAALLPELEVAFSVGAPGVLFDRTAAAFLPVAALPEELYTDADGLHDADGRRIVPILTRMTLHRKREWELLKKLYGGLFAPRKILVIGEDFGRPGNRFSDRLIRLGRERQLEIEFIALPERGWNSGSLTFDALPALLRAIDDSEAEGALLLPPSPVRDPGLDRRESMRCWALLLEKLYSHPNCREIRLATPIPAPADDDRAVEAEYIDALRQLRREYGTGMLELHRVMLDRPDFDTLYVDPAGDDTLMSTLPFSGDAPAMEILDLLTRPTGNLH